MCLPQWNGRGRTRPQAWRRRSERRAGSKAGEAAPGWENAYSIQRLPDARGSQGRNRCRHDVDASQVLHLQTAWLERLLGLQTFRNQGLEASAFPKVLPADHRDRGSLGLASLCPAWHHLRVLTPYAQQAPQRTSGLQAWAASKLPFFFSPEGVGVGTRKRVPSARGSPEAHAPPRSLGGRPPALAAGCRHRRASQKEARGGPHSAGPRRPRFCVFVCLLPQLLHLPRTLRFSSLARPLLLSSAQQRGALGQFPARSAPPLTKLDQHASLTLEPGLRSAHCWTRHTCAASALLITLCSQPEKASHPCSLSPRPSKPWGKTQVHPETAARGRAGPPLLPLEPPVSTSPPSGGPVTAAHPEPLCVHSVPCR